MQTILLQDEPALFRGLEQTLVRREGIRLLKARGDDLLAACRDHRPDVVLLWDENPDPPLARSLRSEPSPPVCLVAADGDAARRALEEAGRRLGLPGRGSRRRCCRLRALLEQGDRRVEGRTRDLGPDGVFVALDPATLPGERVRVRLRRPGARRGPERSGQVVRRVPSDPAGTALAGVAIRFDPGEGLSRDEFTALMGAAG